MTGIGAELGHHEHGDPALGLRLTCADGGLSSEYRSRGWSGDPDNTAACQLLRLSPQRRNHVRRIALNPAGGIGNVGREADTGSGDANSTRELGRAAGGLRKRNRGAAEAPVRHEKIEV